jgi:hypothetical protein
MTVDAANRDEAVAKLKGMMTPDAVQKHFAEKHVGQPVPSMDQVQANIEQTVVEGETGEMAPPTPMPTTPPPAAPSAPPTVPPVV